jgi:heme oxygenase
MPVAAARLDEPAGLTVRPAGTVKLPLQLMAPARIAHRPIVAQAPGRNGNALSFRRCRAPARPLKWPMTMGLAQLLRDGTRALHTETERAGLMPALLRGTLPADRFHLLQRNLLALYDALEPALARHADHPMLAPLACGGLARCALLTEDLVALQGAHWPQTLPVQPAAQAYADRLHHLGDSQPEALVAHAYVRYLGDLSGGQALRRVVRQAYGLPGDTGQRFFDFGPPDQVAALAMAFRSALDALPIDDAGAQTLLAEACWAFRQHGQLFSELAAPPPPIDALSA